MIGLTLGRRHYDIPARWEEVGAGEFVYLAEAMHDFEAGTDSFEQFRLRASAALVGVRPQKLKRLTDTLSENLFRLSELLGFVYDIDGSEAALTVCLNRNLLPEVRGVKGYTFRHEPSGELDSDLSAEQYIDAVSLMQFFVAAGQESTLYNLAQTLYPGLDRKRRPDTRTLYAVFYNFRGILEYLRRLPSYRLIFHEPLVRRQERNPVGMAASIYSLAKAGYGDLDLIKSLPLFTYLDLLLQQTIESIKTYSGSGMKSGEISEKMNVPLDLIIPYLEN
ncbi:MAG: hypothetical protein IJU69_00160 [Bacteroidales bacterium]|nr:hypothetical protein [Bacteroidales bacterium]